VKKIKTIADLTPDSMNANEGTEYGTGMLEDSLRFYGAGRSILVDKNGKIIAGNKTAEMAGQIGIEDVEVVQTDGNKLIVVQRTDLDMDIDVRARALGIADNRTGETNLAWNSDALKQLAESGVCLEKFWSKEALQELVGSENGNQDPEPQINKAAELQEKWGTQLGDLWEIESKSVPGKSHRIICGDCTDKAVVERVMGGEKANFVFTDPPYGIGYQYSGYEDKREGYYDFMKQVFWTLNGILDDDSAMYVKQYTHNLFDFYQVIPKNWNFKNLIVWKNNSQAHPEGNFDNAFEVIYEFDCGQDDDLPAMTFWQKGKPYFDAKAEKRMVVWDGHHRMPQAIRRGKMWNIWDDIPPLPGGCMKSKESLSDGGEKLHSCQMPAGLPMRAMNFSSKEGSLCFDPFLGSGTTAVAAENLGRLGRGCEISPAYTAVSLQRLADMSLEIRKVE